jgi:hypothetical protein
VSRLHCHHIVCCFRLWLWRLLFEGPHHPTLLKDNQTCVKMSESLASTPRMQHLGARCHWLREQVVHDKALRLDYANTPTPSIRLPTASPSRSLPTTSADFVVHFRVWLLYRILILVLDMGALASHWLRPIPCHCSLMCSGGFPTFPSVCGRRGSDPPESLLSSPPYLAVGPCG